MQRLYLWKTLDDSKIIWAPVHEVHVKLHEQVFKRKTQRHTVVGPFYQQFTSLVWNYFGCCKKNRCYPLFWERSWKREHEPLWLKAGAAAKNSHAEIIGALLWLVQTISHPRSINLMLNEADSETRASVLHGIRIFFLSKKWIFWLFPPDWFLYAPKRENIIKPGVLSLKILNNSHFFSDNKKNINVP